jgi:excisionase family DNA binding protein
MLTKQVFYTVTEVAEVLRCSRAEVYLLITRGVLPSRRIGSMIRVPADALNKLLTATEQASPAAEA